MAEISVIIPVYKMEKCIKRAYASLKNQTFADFEAIFVNDGSPDNSGKILDEIAKDDERVKVIHKPNGGVASARNAALDAATGKYVLFLDPDDFLENDAFEGLHGVAEKENTDIVMFGIVKEVHNEKGEVVSKSVSLPPVIGVFDNEPLKNMFDKFATTYLIAAKMYRREIIEKNGCRFENRSIGEDGLFALEIYATNPKCLAAIDKTYYHYVFEPKESLSSKFHPERMTDNFYLSTAAENVVKKWGLEKSEMHTKTVDYCIVRDLQLGIKNTSLSGLSFGERYLWLKNIMRDKKVKKAVSATKLSMAESRNDKIKLMLLKLRMYRTVTQISKLNRRDGK